MLPGSFASGRVFLSMSMLCARSLRYWGTGYFRTLSAARSDGVFLSWSRFHPQRQVSSSRPVQLAGSLPEAPLPKEG